MFQAQEFSVAHIQNEVFAENQRFLQLFSKHIKFKTNNDTWQEKQREKNY